MKIGETLYLDIQNNHNEIEQYRCKLIDKNNQYLYIDYPVHDKTLKTLFVPNNKTFHVTYRVNQNVYRFRSYVVKRMKASIPTLVIYLPHKQEHERIQRREYVRIQTSVDTAIHCPNHSFAPLTTVTADISGGGLSVFINDTIFQDNQSVQVRLVLNMMSGHFYYILAEAAFIRYKRIEGSNVQTASLMFTSISKNDRQQIIHYCFEKQREERKKELIYNKK